MIEEQDWTEAYKELCDLVKPQAPRKGIKEINHQDLWHEQIDFIEDEYPWPSDSLFYNFTAEEVKTVGGKVQECRFLIDVIFVMHTLADSYAGSKTQDVTLSFIKRCKAVHKLFQGTSGKNFSSMDRIAIRRVPAPQYLMAYAQTYAVTIMDYSAVDEKQEREITGFNLKKGEAPETPKDWALFESRML